jgi:hypothetical protein
MINPGDDQYADQEFKDAADFMGSSDSSLEQGVVAVMVAAGLWFFFHVAFWPFVLLALLYLFGRMFVGKTDPRALLARIMLLPSALRRFGQRLHVRVVVKMLPEDVTDAADLRGRLFHAPPQNLDHEHYRETFCVLALTDRTSEQDLQLSQYLRGLKAYGEDPLRMMASQLKRKMAPSTQPQPLAGVQGFASVPIPGLSSLSMYLAAACVVLLGMNMWAWQRAGNHAAEARAAEETARGWQESAMANAANATEQARRRSEETERAREELENSRKLAETAQGRARRLAARERERNEQAVDGMPVDLDGRLRGLAEPAAGADSPPADTGADSGNRPG